MKETTFWVIGGSTKLTPEQSQFCDDFAEEFKDRFNNSNTSIKGKLVIGSTGGLVTRFSLRTGCHITGIYPYKNLEEIVNCEIRPDMISRFIYDGINNLSWDLKYRFPARDTKEIVLTDAIICFGVGGAGTGRELLVNWKIGLPVYIICSSPNDNIPQWIATTAALLGKPKGTIDIFWPKEGNEHIAECVAALEQFALSL